MEATCDYGRAAMTVDIDKLRALLAILGEENVAEFEHESEGVRVRIVRGGYAAAQMPMMQAMPAKPTSV